MVKPEHTEQLVPRFRTIVIPAAGAPFSNRALRNACRLSAVHSDVQLRLVYLMEIPRAFALATSLPGEEAMADRVLAEAAEIASEYRCTAISDIQRGRDLADTLLHYIGQNNADLVVLGARPDGVRGVPLALAREIYDRSSVPVLLDYIGGDINTGADSPSRA